VSRLRQTGQCVGPAAETIANSPEEWSRFWHSRLDRPERDAGGVRRVNRSVAIIAAMARADEDVVLEVVDRVLADLALRGRMFVGRRAEASDRATVVIQTGEEGRYRLRLPDLMAPETVEGFMADAQQHLGEIFGEPVPHCPVHDHALLGKVTGAEIEWVCPDGAWRCPLGEYEERTWPPGSQVPAGAVAAALVQRFERRGVTGWQRAGASLHDDVWVARVRVWPIDEALIDAIRRAAAPVEVSIEPGEAPDLGAWQREMDRRLTENLAWADWAIRRWDTFPVDRMPRPLVLVAPSVSVDGGFDSAEAKLAFLDGAITSAVPIPEAVLESLPQRRDRGASSGPEPQPLVLVGASRSTTEFSTDRGRRELPAWRLDTDATSGPIWVLDPDIASQAWAPENPTSTARPPGTPREGLGDHARPEADGRTLTFYFTGAPPDQEQYPRAEVIESPQAIALVPVAKDVGRPGIRILPGHGHKVVAHLQAPLGARVLVDLHGNPIEVHQANPIS
jgi:hypothetical protein